MKNRIILVLGVALVASGISVRAGDTPDQAAARAALEQKMDELDHAQSAPPADTNSVSAMAKPAESFTSATNATSVVAAAPAGEVPAAVAPAKAAPAATAPADADFPQKIPADNASAQAAALAALQQKMTELDQRAAQPPADANSMAAVTKRVKSTANSTGTAAIKVVTSPTAPAAEDSAAGNALAQAAALAAVRQKMTELNQPETQPVTETPTAQAPVAISPGIVPSTAVPVSSAPAVVAPAPEVSAAPDAAAAVAVAPAANAESVAMPAGTQPAAAPAAPGPALAVPAPILPSSSPGQARPVNQLVTTTGAIYKDVEVESVKDDGLIISYTAANGSWAMTKVYFEDLPAEIRQQYGK